MSNAAEDQERRGLKGPLWNKHHGGHWNFIRRSFDGAKGIEMSFA